MSILENYAKRMYNKKVYDCDNTEIYNLLMELVTDETAKLPTRDQDEKKKLYYFSAEFLIGKVLSNNLINLGIYNQINNELIANGKSLMDIEHTEKEPSLGNGGLGRLAACFVDSITKMGINGDGVGLNYHFGLFKQEFDDNQQVTVPDEWLTDKNWIRRTQISFEVPYRDFVLKSTLYDLNILGYKQTHRNRLRLFDLDSVNPNIIEEGTINFNKNNIKENLTLFLYPDDSSHEGRLLRIYQQYFMVSNGAQLILHEAKEKGSNLHDLADYAVIQINDTHPTFIIPELIRLLVEKGIDFDEATDIVSSITAFTNHTILAEALEKWPISDLECVMPHLVDEIRRLDDNIRQKYPNNPETWIIDDYSTVHMANMAIHYGFSVNGVAELHTEILKTSALKPFYDIYPDKFHNMTNGITFRRWVMDANKELSEYLDLKVGTLWHRNADLRGFLDFKDDERTLTKLRAIKHNSKLRLKKRLKDRMGIDLDEHSIIDIQIKRMHEYKRQQMNALWVIYKYCDIKNGNIPETPITVIFGGKAAPAYTIAQDIIHLILTLSELIRLDDEVAPHLQVIMVENYNVTYAQYLIPAADISEQISLASKEASGTGNMKLMANGALTIGTLDGANVEIRNEVGDDNIYIFGKESHEIIDLYNQNAYNSHEYYTREQIKPLVDFIISHGMLYFGNEERLYRLHNELVTKDYFMTLIDLEDYIETKEQMLRDYEDIDAWYKKSVVNIAKSGFFSSDRTIANYNDTIWHLPVSYGEE
ncbi:glycogen/starch/alpha-glucan family phosphorylase [Facklamia sp. DSM 111018]|uniref:Alpha-1,4 glucan phosphorylase n=1 Tax=Facklamia lactis TaxID=2749967 RepID=A0ABS0LPV5_9LACT|nr:glycogen/starch/alpha-glucan phosphorylase [Facklamia lactis]MBG9980219.1 glycogen/starch/alpha-glucan family phosphorylase [Facklamia lactis]MBG9986022.1 glycogen/starch/alpha-glucan family phosphorylase [Facklamia lactis]